MPSNNLSGKYFKVCNSYFLDKIHYSVSDEAYSVSKTCLVSTMIFSLLYFLYLVVTGQILNFLASVTNTFSGGNPSDQTPTSFDKKQVQPVFSSYNGTNSSDYMLSILLIIIFLAWNFYNQHLANVELVTRNTIRAKKNKNEKSHKIHDTFIPWTDGTEPDFSDLVWLSMSIRGFNNIFDSGYNSTRHKKAKEMIKSLSSKSMEEITLVQLPGTIEIAHTC